jgi:PleD family two-component response regulator
MCGARLDRGATCDPAQDEANTPEALMRDADATLYRAKGGGSEPP